jgi:HK97 family phage portal protein
MSFMSRLPRPSAVSSTLEQQIREYFGGGSTSSGVAVNSDSAMRLVTVYACVKVLYQSIAQMPCHFMVQAGDGKTKVTNKAMDHRLYRILHDQPNSWMSAPEFWGMSVAHVSLRGDFLAFKVMTGNQIRELLPIDPSRLQEIKQNSDWSLTYRISTAENWDGSKPGPAREYRDYSQKEIFHIRGMSLDGYSGLNPIAYARESIGVGMASEKFKAQYFGKGLHPGAILEHPLRLAPQDHANMLAAYKIKYAGLNNSQDMMLVDDGMKIQFPPIKLVDQQFLENEKFTEARIASLFRVPLMLLQAGDNPTTFASAEQFMIAFVTHALTPIVVNIEKAIYRDLLTEEEKKNYFAKFEMRGLLRGAFKEQMEAFQIAVNTCIMNPNEVRDALDMNAYVGGEAYATRTSTVKQDGKAPAVPGEGATK